MQVRNLEYKCQRCKKEIFVCLPYDLAEDFLISLSIHSNPDIYTGRLSKETINELQKQEDQLLGIMTSTSGEPSDIEVHHCEDGGMGLAICNSLGPIFERSDWPDEDEDEA